MVMEQKALVCQIDGAVATLTLNQPPANTFTLDLLQQLRQRMHQLNADTSIHAVVLTGAGERFFSAGADLKSFSGDVRQARIMIESFAAAFAALLDARPVVIAAINGYAMGGGLECALACDIRIAEAHAQLALPEPAVGLLPGAGGTQLLPHLVGEGWAKRMILTGERIDAVQAERIGLVQQVVPTGSALQAAQTLAQRVTALSPRAVAASKQLIHLSRKGLSQADALVNERDRFMALFDSEDRREGVQAFLEKRAPVWRTA